MRNIMTTGTESSNISEEELARVSGGVIYDHNYVSKDVIDARGGQLVLGNVSIAYDLNGNISGAWFV